MSGPSTCGPVAHDQDRIVLGRDVLACDAVDVGLGDGFDPGLIMGELIVGQVVGDQDRDLAGDAEVVSKRLRETLNDPLLGEGQLGVGDRALPVMSVSSLMISTSDSLVTAVWTVRRPRTGPGLEERKARLGARSCSPCPREGSC